MNNLSTNVDNSPNSLWQKALNLSANAVLVVEQVSNPAGAPSRFRIQLANRVAEKSLGLTDPQPDERWIDTVFTDSVSLLLSADLEHVIGHAESLQRESFYVLPHANLAAWFHVAMEPLGDGHCAVITFTNITEWKQTQQNLLGDSILFKTLSSTVPEMGVVAIDFFQKIALANGQIPNLFKGNKPDQLIGRRFIETIEPHYAADWQHYLLTAFSGEQHFFSDHWGGDRCEVYVGPVRNATGQIVMVLVVFKNVSEQFQQQQALQQANLSLHQSNESLERFAYVASHDLQEPLRKIRSFGDLLTARYGDQLDELGRDLLGRMQSAAQRMDELIRSLLTFSRINPPLLPTTPLDLNDLFVGILTDLEVIIQEKGALVSIQTPLPRLRGDETQLRQLFQNLLTNALKFTAPNTRPQVRVTHRLVNAAEIPATPDFTPASDAQFVEISVSDNGIGIAQENHQKIFGLFTRLHNRTLYAGTGIGLATTKRVAENHGGIITLESQEGQGTTFRVYLPA